MIESEIKAVHNLIGLLVYDYWIGPRSQKNVYRIHKVEPPLEGHLRKFSLSF